MAGYMQTKDVADALGTNKTKVLEYASRIDDPLPLRYIKGKRNGGFVIVDEFDDWIRRNTCFFNERDEYRKGETCRTA